MLVKTKSEFIKEIQKFDINTEYVVVKPNWVSNEPGEYTEPEILDWLFEALPDQKKIVIESYTPWRGLKFIEDDDYKGKGVTLEGGKKHWQFYKKQDKHFLKATGIGEVLKKQNVDYINITNEVWGKRCVQPEIIKKLVTKKGNKVAWEQLYSYIPKKLFEIREKSTLISLSKIKAEESIPVIHISMSVKNLFGLIPHPSRWIPFHGEGHSKVPQVIKDVYVIYISIFGNGFWITEGIRTMVRNYCEPNQIVVEDKNLLFLGNDAKKVDSEACKVIGLDPKSVPHLEMI